MLHDDVVAEVARRARARVRDQGFVGVELEREFVAQEPRQLTLDLLGFGLGSDETQEVIVGVTRIAQPPVAGITRITDRQATQLPEQLPSLGSGPALTRILQSTLHSDVLRIASPAHSPGVLWDQDCLDKVVQLVQIDVGQDR